MNTDGYTKVERAMMLLEAGDIENGLADLACVRREYKEDAELMVELIGVYHELGHGEEALSIVEEFDRKNEGIDLETRVSMELYRVSLYMDIDRLEEAASILIDMKEERPDDARVFALLGELYLMEGLEEVAIRYLERAEELDPDNEEISYLLGRLYAEQGAGDRALAKWQQLENFEEDEQIGLEIARLAAQSGEFEKAASLFEQAAEQNEKAEALYGAGVMRSQLGQWQSAVRHLARLIDLDAEYMAAYPLLADALWQLGMQEQALAVYEQALGLHIEEEKLLDGYLPLLAEVEQWRKIDTLASRLREIDEDNPAYWYWKGRAAEGVSDIEEALACYEEAMAEGESVYDVRARYEQLSAGRV
ncbi:tetratricopeptide repeat protein [Aneurinibacillus soli]|uniref:Tetratricopeptide repeat protein n=1 Tax=Aneurinibacillus soli TaxID=1500254 RepID=A0A0U5BDU8_9BACL|nr:tetratricopeptide repeat protein [Aneurinibacillus soli]PYE63064.1 tetratricopeptide repeat protein [Aneurinibacillus soli]BAU28877.1 tetratricopeptide repeat protein [Aneurinibacillus soli]